MKFFTLFVFWSLHLAAEMPSGLHPLSSPSPMELLQNAQTLLFLGDSITQEGTYVADFEAWTVTRFPEKRFKVINAGLSSETVSGLSEQGHADGRFRRPDLSERLERVLHKTRPDLIIACYGMNCGIYQPWDRERFARFQAGIHHLRETAETFGAEIVHVTPPIFDSHGEAGFDYDEVLTTYSAWLVSKRTEGWHVVDLHSVMRAKVEAARKRDPSFTVQKDRVHPNPEGHWMIAQSLITYFGDPASAQAASASKLLEASRRNAIMERMRLYRNAIHAETDPKHPEAPKGGNLEDAARKAAGLNPSIYPTP